MGPVGNSCLDCGKKNPKFCLPNENKKRCTLHILLQTLLHFEAVLISVVGVRPGCADCASKNHPEAVKLRTKKEQRQREDRCAVFQWARREGGEQQRCAYWIVQDCPNLKAGKTCDRVHE